MVIIEITSCIWTVLTCKNGEIVGLGTNLEVCVQDWLLLLKKKEKKKNETAVFMKISPAHVPEFGAFLEAQY